MNTSLYLVFYACDHPLSSIVVHKAFIHLHQNITCCTCNYSEIAENDANPVFVNLALQARYLNGLLHPGVGFKVAPFGQFYYEEGINFFMGLSFSSERMKCPMSLLC
jgi:hypothetical protein